MLIVSRVVEIASGIIVGAGRPQQVRIGITLSNNLRTLDPKPLG